MPPKILSLPHLLKKLPLWAYAVLFLGFALCIALAIWLLTDRGSAPYTQPNYGHMIEKERIEDAFGWGSELLIDKKEDRPANIRFMLRDIDRKPVKNATVTINFSRPQKDAPAVDAVLDMLEPGVYRGIVDLPKKGLWEAHVAVQTGNTAYQVNKRVNVP